jgi:hypothetical protein
LLDEIPIGNFTPEIKELLEKCAKLEYLSLDTCTLNNLSLMPVLPKLEVIELNNNRFRNCKVGSSTKMSKFWGSSRKCGGYSSDRTKSASRTHSDSSLSSRI